MLSEGDVFSKSYKLYSPENIVASSRSVIIHDLDSFKPKSLRKLKSITLMNVDLRFESIVNFLSNCEDQYGLDLNELNLNIRENLKNYKTFFELLDFYYGYNDLKISIVANNSNTPFEIMLNVFNQYEISTYTNFGMSLNLDQIISDPWYSDGVFKSIDKFVLNGFSEMDSKYLIR